MDDQRIENEPTGEPRPIFDLVDDHTYTSTEGIVEMITSGGEVVVKEEELGVVQVAPIIDFGIIGDQPQVELAQEEGEHLVFVDGVLMPLPPTFAPAQDTAATAMVTGLTVEEAVEEAASEGLFNEIIEEDPDDVPEMDLDDNNNQRMHHSGKVEIVYQTDRSRRRDTFYKRKRGLLKKARELSIVTNAKITLRIQNSDTNNTFAYYSHDELKPSLNRRHLRVQVGDTIIPETKAELQIGRPARRMALETPTKKVVLPPPAVASTSRPTTSSTPAPSSTPDGANSSPPGPSHEESPIVGLPGKKARKSLSLDPTGSGSKVSNKCAICKVIFDSQEDKALKKKHRKQNSWLGCDTLNCKYWAHARCAGITLKWRQDVKLVPFSCPQHSVQVI